MKGVLGLRSKCKICGYRFKSRDEAICPECFTAREDDISCERYSASEHSHGRSYSAGLVETGESFVQQELREERRNAFARENFGDRANAGLDLSDFNNRYDQSRFVRNDYNYDHDARRVDELYRQQQQPQPQQSAYQRYIAQQQRKSNSGTTGFVPADQIFAKRSIVAVQQANKAKQKKGGAGAFVFLMIFVISFIVVIARTAAQEQENQERQRSYTAYTTYHTTTRKTTTTKKTTTTQASTSKLKEGTKSSISNLGHFNAEIDDAVFEQADKKNIDKRLLGSSTNSTNDEEPWEIVTFTVKITATDKQLADPKNTVITTTTLQCLENARANDTMSYSVYSDNQDIDVSGDGTLTTVTLLANKNAKLMYFSLFFKNAGVTESCRFKITRD